jgi:hypothetical protein
VRLTLRLPVRYHIDLMSNSNVLDKLCNRCLIACFLNGNVLFPGSILLDFVGDVMLSD